MKPPKSQLAKQASSGLSLPEQQLDSRFGAARLYAATAIRLGKQAAHHAVLCGLELVQLFEAHGFQHGGDRKSKPHTAVLIDWPNLVQQQVGISDDTARRWMAAARAQAPALVGLLMEDTGDIGDDVIDVVAEVLRQEPDRVESAIASLAEHKTLEQLMLPLDQAGTFDPSRLFGKAATAWTRINALAGEWDPGVAASCGYSAEEFDSWHEHAIVAKRNVEEGQLSPTRAWAGLMGRAATAGENRKAVDHKANLRLGLTKIFNSLAHWDSLHAEDRMELEADWMELWKQLPGSWKATAKKLEEWR